MPCAEAGGSCEYVIANIETGFFFKQAQKSSMLVHQQATMTFLHRSFRKRQKRYAWCRISAFNMTTRWQLPQQQLQEAQQPLQRPRQRQQLPQRPQRVSNSLRSQNLARKLSTKHDNDGLFQEHFLTFL